MLAVRSAFSVKTYSMDLSGARADGEAGRLDDRCCFPSPPVNGSSEREGGVRPGTDAPRRPAHPCASLRRVRATGLGVSAALWINQRICVSVLVRECV